MGSWGRQSTYSRHTPGEPVRQDGIGKSFWHSRRTGTEPSKAQASGLDELPSSIRRNLFLNHRHALRNLHYSKKRTRLITGTPPDTLPAAPLSATKNKSSVPAYTGTEPFLGLVGASKHAFPAYAGGTREAGRLWKVFLAFPPYTGTEPSKAQLPGLMNSFRHTAEPLPQPSARAIQPSLQQKADKADHRDATGYPPAAPIRHPKTKGSVPAYTGAEPFLGLVGRQSTHSRHTPGDP